MRFPDIQLELPFDATLAEIPTLSPWCQRSTDGAHSWRHASAGGFDKARFEVHPLGEADAKSFVIQNHYAASYPAASRRYGLFDTAEPGAAELVGVAVFGIPVQAQVLTGPLPTLAPYVESLELSRFVLVDAVPANAESWFLARCFTELLADGIRGVVSFADPVPRRAATGELRAVGHVGTIYQASNAVYTGRGTPRTLTLLPDGTVLNARSISKVRRGEQGHEYVEQRLVSLGAGVPAAGADMGAWMTQALLDVGSRRLRHRGNHRYVFRLGTNRRQRERIPLGVPAVPTYPKSPDLS